ncbi:MAG: hypothetical protein AB1507_01840 [Bacillota bacterium]|nr:hypothetical protein [Thermoanaerobacteraceae bacterium]
MAFWGFGFDPNALKVWLDQIALICLSEDFQKLKAELELLYREADPAQADVKAFADALYAFLSEQEENLGTSAV